MKTSHLLALVGILGLLCLSPMEVRAKIPTPPMPGGSRIDQPPMPGGKLPGRSTRSRSIEEMDELINKRKENARLATEAYPKRAQAPKPAPRRVQRRRVVVSPPAPRRAQRRVVSPPAPRRVQRRVVSRPAPRRAPTAIAQPTKKLTKKLEKPDLKQVTFLCSVDDSVPPATLAQINAQGNLSVILWTSDFFTEAGYDPQTRCKQVSARFETYKKNDNLVYITTGKINRQPVICVTSKEQGNCGEGIPVHEGLLFTLKPYEKPQETLEQLVAVLESKEPEQKPLEE